MSNSPTLQVICPVYNEEAVIEQFYNTLKPVLQSLEDKYQWKILFVMDRSDDRSLDILRSIASKDSKVQVIALSTRFGHQMSLVAGIDHVDADAVIMMDSDLQHPPALIPEMVDAYEKGYEVVYTIRSQAGESSIIRRTSSRSFYHLINWLSEVSIHPGVADFRLISKRVANVFHTQIRERNQFLRGLFSWVGYKSIGISYEVGERASGKSKYNYSRMLRLAFTGIVSFSKKPLQYAIIIGLFFAAFGMGFAVFSLIEYSMNDKVPSGWTTLAILISIFGGIQLFFLGVLGEYLSAIFDEVKGRPLYLIEESINLE